MGGSIVDAKNYLSFWDPSNTEINDVRLKKLIICQLCLLIMMITKLVLLALLFLK